MRKRLTKIGALLVIGCASLLSYVKWQWPDEVKELDIPLGRVMYMPGGGKIKGICVSGDPNVMAIWYRVSSQIYDEEKNKYIELRPDDHYYWCEQALVVRAGMDGLLGQSAVFQALATESTEHTEKT